MHIQEKVARRWKHLVGLISGVGTWELIPPPNAVSALLNL